LKRIALGSAEGPIDCSAARVRIVRYPPHVRFARHAHESTSVCMVLRGGFEEESRDGTHSAAAGDCVVKPAGTWHANSFGDEDTVTIQLELSDAAADIREYRCRADAALAARMLAVYRAARSAACTRTALDELVVDALGAVVAVRMQRARPGWLGRVEGEIRLSLGGVVRVSDLAALAGVHPVHLARVFQHIHGCGVVEYVRRLRVRDAAQRLAGSGRPLCDIALEAGFCDQAHFTHAFRREMGVAPGEYRRLVTR
jgi:AraC family transcriptional regulator